MMSQYDNRVEKQRIKIEAEEWAKGINTIHAHSLHSMWYDTRPDDTANGRTVTDIEFNDGSIRRELDNGEIVILGHQLKGQALVDQFSRAR